MIAAVSIEKMVNLSVEDVIVIVIESVQIVNVVLVVVAVVVVVVDGSVRVLEQWRRTAAVVAGTVTVGGLVDFVFRR